MNTREIYAIFLDGKDTYYTNLIFNLEAFAVDVMTRHDILGEKHRSIHQELVLNVPTLAQQRHSWKLILRK